MGKVFAVFACILVWSAWAKDSTELSLQRRKLLESASFYCAIGRNPIEYSYEAFNIVPNKQCRFSGGTDTKLDPNSLQPPVLNPLVSFNDVQSIISNVGGGFSVALQNYKNLKDPMFRFHVYPPEWGDNFPTITGQNFGRLINSPALFWNNPYFEEEKEVLPRRQASLPYLPIELVSKCQPIPVEKSKSLLLVGDLHELAQAQYFLNLLDQRSFAFAALEVDHTQQGLFAQFVETTNSATEAQLLNFFVRQFPNKVQETYKNILMKLKSKKTKVVFINSTDAYTNFPFTNVSFHGLIMGTRNLVWAKHLPDDWAGQGVLFGGLDHFTSYPGSDFQNFALERFPGLLLSLVNPLENCVSN